MSEQYPGGWLTKSPQVPQGPYENSAAPGLWTLSQQAAYQKQGLWPTAGNQAPDPYFNYVTMLLHGDGTNGGQNNTFLDSSTNNFTITRNGNTTQGSFSPYGSLWSNYFDGNVDRFDLTLPSGGLGSGNFTLEYWFYPTSLYNYITVFSTTRGASGFNVGTDASGLLVWYSGGARQIQGGTIVANQWHHAAFVRNGSTLTAYLNGVSVGTATVTTNFSATAAAIGNLVGANDEFVAGYLSNVRLVVGTAVYTSAFTPPTQPLTAVSGTSLLACQSNRFIDTSTNNLTLTPSGDVRVTNFAPFNPTAAYSTATNGGSGYFDGSGDYLSIADNNAFDVGSSNFTLEAWFYPTTGGVLAGIAGNWSTASQAVRSYALYVNSENRVFFIADTGTTQPNIGSTQSFNLNTWNHVAAVRNGTTLTIYLNGVEGGNTTLSTSLQNASIAFVLGDLSNGGYPFFGYLSQPRLVVGTAVYTAPFNPPSAPLTAITNTQLLCNFTNGAIFDNSMKNDLETVGNAQISTSVKKYGTGSLAFDGSGDWLSAALSENFNYSSGDFTVELWLYLNSNPGADAGIVENRPASTNGNYFMLGVNSSGRLFIYVNAAYRIGPTAGTQVSTGAWTHIAYVRSSGTGTLYVSGTSVGSWSDSTTYVSGPCVIGHHQFGASDLNGYIDDLRITKGYARYTANFTPPTQAFPNN